MNYILRDYQKELSQKAVEILRLKKIVYLSMEVRTGKTLTALNTAEYMPQTKRCMRRCGDARERYTS